VLDFGVAVAVRIRPRLLCLLSSVLLAASCQTSSDRSPSPTGTDVRLVTDTTTVESLVPRDATLEGLLRQEKLPAELTSSIVDAVRGVFNPRDLKAEQTYWISRGLDGLFREFRYEINADKLLRVVFRSKPEDSVAAFDVEVVNLPREYEGAAVSAEISAEANSLYAAFDANGENEQLPLKLAEIFGGDVDFNSDLKRGDRIDVLFDRAVRHGEFVGYGDVRAAVMSVNNRRITAFRHVDGEGKPAWYDEQGKSLRRQFLKSPLQINPRVTSGFSHNRFHPVHGVARPHLGVDFGAPTGTPVLAVASGVVELAGWSGEAGRMVRIRHSGGYKTAYLHLSGFAPGIVVGARVDQGEVIGRVGMTGTATGPHLDYRVMKNEAYLNPLTAFRNVSGGDAIAPADLSGFVRARDAAVGELQRRLSELYSPSRSASAPVSTSR
jgi:murein DD-endopeptidase MepM/ murein hydrolase activator NlpD